MNTRYYALKAEIKAGFSQAIRQFGHREDGAIISFALLTIVMMLMITGLAVDVMRAEDKRTKIQYTQDRAVLAAASLRQNLSPQDIIDDYFLKEGLQDVTPTAVVVDELNLRRVTVDYDDSNMPSINTMFMDIVGVDTLATVASSGAADGIGKVEISLVLDVSGSMGSTSVSGDTKINDLRTAAKEFVDTLLSDDSAPNTYSISVVPYAMQVTAGEELLDNYNTTSEHNSSHCVEFTPDDFTSASLSTTDLLQRDGHFAPFSRNPTVPINWWDRHCVTDDIPSRKILALSDNQTELENYIDGLQPAGWTSTEVGIKWGTALLDPSAQDVVSNMVISGDIEAGLDGRPYDYSESGVRKVMVVMTDGANTYHWSLDPSKRTGLSNVWRLPLGPDGAAGNRFWVFNPSRGGPQKYRELQYNNAGTSTSSPRWVSSPGNGATQMTYPELWDLLTMGFVARTLYAQAGLSSQNWYNGYWANHFTLFYPAEKDTRMENMCTAAKDQGILLYTIGFEVSNSNAAKLTSCATTDAHFFRVEGVEISEAFASIAAQISNLKLIQ